MLEYGSEAYSSAAKSYFEKIETIQNSALRVATGAFRSSPISSLHSECGIKPFTYYLETKHLNFYLRIILNPQNPLRQAALNFDELPEKCFLHRMGRLAEQYGIDFGNVLDISVPEIAPWSRKRVVICTEMHQYKKGNYAPQELKNLFNEHFETHTGNFNIFTDGSKTTNGVGSVFSSNRTESSFRLSNISTNYTAELVAIYSALKYAMEEKENRNRVTIITDCRSTIQAIEKYYNRHSIIQNIHSLLAANPAEIYYFCWVPSHVGVRGNETVDTLARDVVENGEIVGGQIPQSDLKIHIKKQSVKSWSNCWRQVLPERNKLRNIKDVTTPLPDSICEDRHWERTVCRLRIGHTALTHGHLMEREPPPICEECDSPLTVIHLIAECEKYNRWRHTFGDLTFKELMTEHMRKHGLIYNFLQNTDIINLI